jgi:hypothetical protein
MQFFAMSIDTMALYNDIFSNPAAEDTPGKNLIDIALVVKGIRLVIKVLCLLTSNLGAGNEPVDLANSYIGMLTGIVNYLQYASAIQPGSTPWKGHDVEMLLTAAADSRCRQLP